MGRGCLLYKTGIHRPTWAKALDDCINYSRDVIVGEFVEQTSTPYFVKSLWNIEDNNFSNKDTIDHFTGSRKLKHQQWTESSEAHIVCRSGDWFLCGDQLLEEFANRSNETTAILRWRWIPTSLDNRANRLIISNLRNTSFSGNN